ncbi:MAG TPA: DUF5667 domain-containing protein [Candidatus Paceibacterota bacterium]
MKKPLLMIASILFISLAFVVPMQASAATNAGLKPGSFFYFFDTTFENIGLFFTFDSEQKAKKALGYADERLAEIEAIAEEKNPDAVKTAIANYESNVALATEKSKEVKDKGQAEGLFTLIEGSTSRNQEVLAAVLIKVPEEAKAAITQAIEASKKGQEEATKQIAELRIEIERLKNEVAELKKESDNPQADEVEKLKKEVETLKKQNTVQPAPKHPLPPIQNLQEEKKPEEKAKTTTTTLPSGAVAEIDANGNIIRIIKEAPQQTYVAPAPQPIVQIKSDLSILRANLDSIGSNSYLSYSSKKGRQEIAIQDWMKQNSSDFSIPSYITQFNVLVSSYGLYHMTIPQ